MARGRGVAISAGDELSPAELSGVNTYVYPRQHSVALRDIPDWYGLGARCSKCKRAALLDRYEIASKYGSRRMLITLEPKLRCTKCGNPDANDFVLAKIHRNW